MSKAMKKITVDEIVGRWTNKVTRPKFHVGALVAVDTVWDDDLGKYTNEACRCAQGDVLHVMGWSDTRMAGVGDSMEGDKAVAKALGITLFQSRLLRVVNDSEKGTPEDVLRAPEKLLGPGAPAMLAAMRHIEGLKARDWAKVNTRIAAISNAVRNLIEYHTTEGRELTCRELTCRDGETTRQRNIRMTRVRQASGNDGFGYDDPSNLDDNTLSLAVLYEVGGWVGNDPRDFHGLHLLGFTSGDPIGELMRADAGEGVAA